MDEALWDAIAKVERRHWWFRGRRELVANVLLQHVERGASVLDVGCGTGFVLERLAEHFDAWGCEPDPGVRARATEGIRNRILPGSTDNLVAARSRQYAAVMLLDVLEHLDDDVAALQQIRPVLEPGGVVLITVPALPLLWTSHDDRNSHRRRYTRKSLSRVIAAAGMAPVTLSYVNARLFPLALAARLLSRVTGSRSNRELAVPPAPLNRVFANLFAGEWRAVHRGYPIGLSLLAVVTEARG